MTEIVVGTCRYCSKMAQFIAVDRQTHYMRHIYPGDCKYEKEVLENEL